ncbi:hypothetical protein [Methylobacterium oryzae]|uniref:Uncharacterized protein n=1 Tax=Methylobacterium oryzae TaxID=334852 RepID=A0ABU7THX9_9HYPH
MSALKQRQGAVEAAPEPTRTPERQALADAIAAKNYVAELIQRKRDALRTVDAARDPHWDERTRLEAMLPSAPSSERHRLDALLRGEEPEEGVDKDAIKKQLADNQARIDALYAQSKAVQSDIDLLEGDLQMREVAVRECIRKVVRADPAQAAVSAELVALNARRAFLGRAAENALNEYEPGAPDRFNVGLHRQIVPTPQMPCPWAEAKARLLTDPDAALPMPADV